MSRAVFGHFVSKAKYILEPSVNFTYKELLATSQANLTVRAGSHSQTHNGFLAFHLPFLTALMLPAVSHAKLYHNSRQ
jgi:hypothetical protein